MKKEIYLDNAAATSVHNEVKQEMLKYFDLNYGNPSSIHSKGLEAKNAIEKSRETIATIFNCKPEEIIFTSGGTESINLALKGIAKSMKNKGNHIITSKVEHQAVLKTCEYLEKYENCRITYLDVDKFGMVNPKDVESAICDNTILVSIMYANNEIGTINAIEEIAKITRKYNIYFHTDACQAAGYCNLEIKKLGVDMLSLNGSKIYGPKGIGILYVKSNIKLVPILHGGGQENNLRSGTENVMNIVGFAKALEISQYKRLEETERLTRLRKQLINGIVSQITNSGLNGHPTKRLPNNINISFEDVDAEAVILYLNEYKIYASIGSACANNEKNESHVLNAIHKSDNIDSIRFTVGKDTTKEDIEKVLDVLPNIINSLRKIKETIKIKKK